MWNVRIRIGYDEDDPLAAKIRQNLKKRKIDFTEPIQESSEDPMKRMIVNSSSGVYIPCVSSYEKPVMKIMSKEASQVAKVKVMLIREK